MAAAQSPSPTPKSVVAEQHSKAPHPSHERRFEAWATRPFALDLNLALSSPLGLAGASLEYAPIRYVSLGGGVGTNFEGLQLAGMLRVRVVQLATGALFVGGGYSQGPFRQWYGNHYGLLSAPKALFASMGHDSPPPDRYWERARWANVEAGIEARRDSGLDVRGFAGIELLLNPKQNQIGKQYPGDPQPLDVVPVVVYFAAAIGFSL